MTLAACIRATLVADEIGLVSARFGSLQVHSRFIALHGFDGRRVSPQAMQGRAVLKGCSSGTVASVPWRLLLDCAARAMHVANLGACDPLPDRPVLLEMDPAAVTEEVAEAIVQALGEAVEEEGLDPARVVLNLPGSGWAQPELAAIVAEACADAAFGIALKGFDGSDEAACCLQAVKPAFVGLDRRWYCEALRSRPARSLLKTVLSMIRDEGAEPILPGIGDAAIFRQTLEMGPCLMSGSFLSHPVEAGGTFEELRPFTPAAGHAEGKIIRLFG